MKWFKKTLKPRCLHKNWEIRGETLLWHVNCLDCKQMVRFSDTIPDGELIMTSEIWEKIKKL
jgi:hypothetical protein